jgi:hypothetical protein
MERRQSPLYVVAIVVALAAVLLALALPERPGRPIPCPRPTIADTGPVFGDCGEPADPRTAERILIGLAGVATAIAIAWFGRRLERRYEPISPPPATDVPPDPLAGLPPPEG